jgi:Tfp pilus assembly protein FimV
MVARSRARYLAPIALVATLAGTYFVVHGAVSGKHANAKSHSAGRARRARGPKNRFYTVQQGDSLTSIAAKSGVRVTALENLNPTADPNSLHPGQRLRLRR